MCTLKSGSGTGNIVIKATSILLHTHTQLYTYSWHYGRHGKVLIRIPTWWHLLGWLLPSSNVSLVSSQANIPKATATHSSTLAWKIPRTEEPGRLQSVGSLGVGHGWATSLSFFTFMHWRRKWQPTPVFLPGESQGWGAWWAAVYGVAQRRTRLKRLSSSSSSSRPISTLRSVLTWVYFCC